MKKYFLILILSAGFFSCKDFKELSISGIEKPKVNKLSQEGIDAEFGMKIKNPNKMSIVVFPSELEGTVNGISVGKIKLKKKVRIKRNSDEVETFHISSDFSKRGFEDIANVIQIVSSGSAKLTLKGNLKAGKWFYRKKFPVEFTKVINLKQ